MPDTEPTQPGPGSQGPSPLEMTFDDRTVTAHPGQTVGAALVEAGVRSWRSTRRGGRPRGVFCGIGVCYDCLISVDGAPGQRACLVPARDGMVLTPGDLTRPSGDEPTDAGGNR